MRFCTCLIFMFRREKRKENYKKSLKEKKKKKKAQNGKTKKNICN